MNGMFRSAVATLLAVVLATFGSNALELAPRTAKTPSTWCCCAETGIDARCTCEGDCCQHEPQPAICSTARTLEPAPGATCVSSACRRAPVHPRATPVLEPFVAVTHACELRDFASGRRFASAALAAPDRATPSPERPPDSDRA